MYAFGDVHGPKLSAAALSTSEQEVSAGSLVENVNAGDTSVLTSAGADSIVTTGRMESTVQVVVAGSPRLPAASTARTENVCAPCARDV